MSFTEKVYRTCVSIPKGTVASYSQIARAINSPKSARAVGNALNKNRSKSVPCHRVIRSDGSVGGFAHGAKAKIRLLESEGVEVIGGRVAPCFLFHINQKFRRG